jgi:hypothetical protein
MNLREVSDEENCNVTEKSRVLNIKFQNMELKRNL